MHYRHAYHAGNFADVFKHTVLCGLLAALSKKDKPWCYLETHAGAGAYDLGSAAALATGEAAGGIQRLAKLADAPAALATYLRIVAEANPQGGSRHYPGSPAFAQALKRPGDRLILCESVEDVAASLRAQLPGAELHLRDGYTAFSLLPPPEKRGLVLIDPAFERRDEYEAMIDFVVAAQPRFAGGVYALWYPIKNRHEVSRFRRRVAKASNKPVLDAWLETGAELAGQMVGCGLAIINPPFGLEAELLPSLKVLQLWLADGPQALGGLNWLKTEAECASAR